MFTDDLSEIWDSSDFQDSFIKDYFGQKKVSRGKAKDALCTSDELGSFHSKKVSRDGLKRSHSDSEDKKVLPKSGQRETKHSCNSLISGGMKKRKKLSNSVSEDQVVKNAGNTLELDEMKFDSSTADSSSLSRKKKKRKPKNKFVDDEQTNSLQYGISTQTNESKYLLEEERPISNLSGRKNNLFQNKLSQKLQGAKFRYLNEMLYSNTGKDALSYFQENEEEFQDYHVGYQSQVSKWPINPVDIIIEELCHTNKQHIIADLGCGEAKIAEAFPKRTVYSFDLIALKDSVTACDMANVPLPSGSVDVVVFCLSLMGTNWKDYLKEGHRLLKLGAELKIAEIESRIEDLNDFIKNIEAHGFSLVNKDVSHKMFILLNFKKVKSKVKTSKIRNVTLKPCLYKKR